jgi:hypothetical protein
MRSIILTIFIMTSAAPFSGGQPPDALKGRLEKQTGRIARPLSGALSVPSTSALQKGVINAGDKFELRSGVGQPVKPLNANVVDSTAVAPVPESVRSTPPVTEPARLSATTIENKVREEKPPGSLIYRKDGSTYRPDSSAKRIVLRMKRFASQYEAEIVEDGLSIAGDMLRRGGNVVVLLDMEAVHVADDKFEFYDTASADESGKQRAISTKQVQSQLRNFMEDGGTVLASEHWAKVWGITRRSSLSAGVRLISPGDIAQLLMDAQSVIDY